MKPKRQEHNRRSKPRCSEFPVLSLIFGDLLLYLAGTSDAASKSDRILVARIMNGVLQVVSSDLRRLDVPLASIPALARHSRVAQGEFEVGKDGACLYWPRLDIKLGWEQLEQIANSLSARAARHIARQSGKRSGGRRIRRRVSGSKHAITSAAKPAN
jgi:hypothetical protein